MGTCLRKLCAWITVCSGALAGGCSTPIHEFAKEPQLSPVGNGLQPVPISLPTSVTRPLRTGATNSLWSEGSAALYRDRRARQVGDVITVLIRVQDRAALDNSSSRSRDGKQDIGLELSHGIDWRGYTSSGSASADTNVSSASEHKGKGSVARSENIDLRIAVVVSSVLPNGNLFVQGSQELRVNYELRVLTVSGIVDVRDVNPDNTVTYDRIAEARMSYGGRGRTMEVQQPRWGHQVIDNLSPF
jgi:flagellar L-ring protein precursor FlgH